jgi:UDP-glucose 4-epimerase
LDLIKTFVKVSEKQLNYKIVGRREGDITAAYADTTLANRELGWQSKLSLADALASAWKWQLKQEKN